MTFKEFYHDDYDKRTENKAFGKERIDWIHVFQIWWFLIMNK